MSRISDALVSRDLITRVLSSHDRRRMVLRITEQGEDMVRRLLPTMFGPLHQLFADIPEPSQRLLLSKLKQLYANFAQLQRANCRSAIREPLCLSGRNGTHRRRLCRVAAEAEAGDS